MNQPLNLIQHRLLNPQDNHGIARWIYTTEGQRTSAGPFAPGDLHGVAYVQQSGLYYVLKNSDPADWVLLRSLSVTGLAYDDAAREVVIQLEDGSELRTSLQAIYTFAKTAATSAGQNATQAAITAANEYTDQEILRQQIWLQNEINNLVVLINEFISLFWAVPVEVDDDYEVTPDNFHRILRVVDEAEILLTDQDIGFVLQVQKATAESVTFAVEPGLTIESIDDSVEILELYGWVTAYKLSATVWALRGGLA